MRFVNAIRLLAILAMLFGGLALSAAAEAQVAVEFSVGFAPPELPVYEQPICPGEGYIWTPGYWAWDDDDQDYYWVPGTWVLAPEVGYLWTPGYWGWGGQAYVFHVGYWGPVVGFYGGIDYGWGYTGRGYYGGRWDRGHFYYNREVNRVDERQIRNVYNERVENHVNVTRVSYNGGNGGVNVRPTPREETAARERHIAPVGAQNQHIQAARGNRELRASANHGKPPIAATARPAAFSGGGVVAARAGGNYNPPANRGGGGANRPANENNRVAANNNRPENNGAGNNSPNRPPNAGNRGGINSNRAESNTSRAETNNRTTYNHSNEVPKHSAPPAEANANQKYQQQQEKLAQRQNQEHQKLQQQQEKEHQRAQQSADAARQQQMEQRHQQQTQQMEQKHQQQAQKMEQRQQPRQQAPPRQNEEKRPPH